MANRGGKGGNSDRFTLLGSKITPDGDCSQEIKRRLLFGRKAMTNVDSVLTKRHYFANKGLYSQGYGLPSGHVWLWELDRKEGRMPKNQCLRTVMLEKTPESPLHSKEIKPVNLKGNQPWILIGWTDAEAEAPVLWSSDVKSLWCWQRLRAEGEEGVRGGDDWMASLMQWTWIWTNFGRWWGTERPGVLQSMGWQKSWTRLGDRTTREVICNMMTVVNIAIWHIWRLLRE